MAASIKYIKKLSAKNIVEVMDMKMKKTSGKVMLGVGLTAAAAAAMTPVVKNMINKHAQTDNKSSFH